MLISNESSFADRLFTDIENDLIDNDEFVRDVADRVRKKLSDELVNKVLKEIKRRIT